MTNPKEITHYRKQPGKRYDIDAILDDPRNWRGVQGQKEQAILRQIVRQGNGTDTDAPKPFQHLTHSYQTMIPISLGAIDRYTGIKRKTAIGLLRSLETQGIIRLEIANAGTRDATYRVELLTKTVERWQLKYVHHHMLAGVSMCYRSSQAA